MPWMTWPPGQQGPTYGLGGWRWRGAYNPATYYRYADLVYSQGATWMATSDGDPTPPPDGSWSRISIPGAPGGVGEQGAQGPQGPAGPQGEAGYGKDPATYDQPLTWVPLVLENDWLPGNLAPAYAREGDGTIWLRGDVTGPGANQIIAHLPAWVVPADTHWWDGVSGGGKILPGDSAIDPGAILAGDPAGDNDLYTSFKAGIATSGGDGEQGGGGDGQIVVPWLDAPIDYVTSGALRRLYGCATKAAGTPWPHSVPGDDVYPPILLYLPMGSTPGLIGQNFVPPPGTGPVREGLGELKISVDDGPFEDISEHVHLHANTWFNPDSGLNPGELVPLQWAPENWTASPWAPEHKVTICFSGCWWGHSWTRTEGHLT